MWMTTERRVCRGSQDDNLKAAFDVAAERSLKGCDVQKLVLWVLQNPVLGSVRHWQHCNSGRFHSIGGDTWEVFLFQGCVIRNSANTPYQRSWRYLPRGCCIVTIRIVPSQVVDDLDLAEVCLQLPTRVAVALPTCARQRAGYMREAASKICQNSHWKSPRSRQHRMDT